MNEIRKIITDQINRHVAMTDTQRAWLANDISERVEREVAKLRTALRDADMAISAGQACRSEGEFNRWMHDSQRYRPHADLIS